MNTNGYAALNRANWTPVTDIEKLALINNLSQGNRHKPIQHVEILSNFMTKTESFGITINASKGFLSPEKDKYIFVAETSSDEDCTYSLGFMNFNNRQMAFTGLAGEYIHKWNSVCFSGVFNPSRTRHTLNVDNRLEAKLDALFGQYLKYLEDIKSSKGFLKEQEINDAVLGKVLVALHRAEVMGSTNITRIIEEFDSNAIDDSSTGWKLYGGFSNVLKRIKNPVDSITTGSVGKEIILKTLGY